MGLGDTLGQDGFNNNMVNDQQGLGDTDIALAAEIANLGTLFVRDSVRTYSQNIGHSLILDHPINGRIGTPMLGVDSQQILIGDFKETPILISVTNQYDVWVENFTNTRFNGTGTGSWANGSLSFS